MGHLGLIERKFFGCEQMRLPDELWTSILKINKRRAFTERLTAIYRATVLISRTSDWYCFFLRPAPHLPAMRWHFYLDSGREVLFWEDDIVYKSEGHPFTGWGPYHGPELPCGRIP